MSLNKTNMLKYISKPLFAGSLIALYDYFLEPKTIHKSFLFYDALVMGGSIMSTDILIDLLNSVTGMQKDYITMKALEPLINIFVYSYGYEFFLNSFSQEGEYTLRSKTMNLFISGIISLSTMMIENPLIEIVSGIKIY